MMKRTPAEAVAIWRPLLAGVAENAIGATDLLGRLIEGLTGADLDVGVERLEAVRSLIAGTAADLEALLEQLRRAVPPAN